MKVLRTVLAAFVCVIVLGCGHGYEGEYTVERESDSVSEVVDAMVGLGGTKHVVIGKDYRVADGRRQEFDEIFVRQTGETKYLVFRRDDAEETWEIVDDNTLVRNQGFVNVTLKRAE